ncbi:MAG: DNA polymerase III subunit delta, partial [Wujia sp.]
MAETSGMTIINNHIKDNSFANVYLMGGNETYLVYQYRDKLVEALIDTSDNMNYLVYKGENAKVDAIADNALSMPFFADRRVIVVEGSDFFKKGNEEVEKLLEELPKTTVIIFVEENIDKRNKLYKTVAAKGCVALFDTPDEKTLLVWLKSLFKGENIDIEDAAIYKLLEAVGTDMNTLVNEAEKLKCYCMDKDKITVGDV